MAVVGWHKSRNTDASKQTCKLEIAVTRRRAGNIEHVAGWCTNSIVQAPSVVEYAVSVVKGTQGSRQVTSRWVGMEVYLRLSEVGKL